jgi:hypothetical protein
MREICARFGEAQSTVGRLVDAAWVPRRPSETPRRGNGATAESAVRDGLGLEFFTGELQGNHDPSGAARSRPRVILSGVADGSCQTIHSA